MNEKYTVVYDCDNGKNWERVSADELEPLAENLLAFGMNEIYIFSPYGSMITPDFPLKKQYTVRVYSFKTVIPPTHSFFEETVAKLGFTATEKYEQQVDGQHIYEVEAFEDFPATVRKAFSDAKWRNYPSFFCNGKEVRL